MTVLHAIEAIVVAFLVGAGGGAWAWNKYKAKAVADLAKVEKKI